MKKRLVILMSVILMAVSLQAQWNFGVKAGIDFANVNRSFMAKPR